LLNWKPVNDIIESEEERNWKLKQERKRMIREWKFHPKILSSQIRLEP
jgi:hypothetical protein